MRLRRALPLAASILAIFAAPSLAHAQFKSVRVQVLDRGQADGIVIRTPNERWIVIDGGTNREQVAYGEELAPAPGRSKRKCASCLA